MFTPLYIVLQWNLPYPGGSQLVQGGVRNWEIARNLIHGSAYIVVCCDIVDTNDVVDINMTSN